MSLGYNNRLLGPRVESGYWGRYQENWGQPQAPASQALLGGLQGFVAEAAIPRFITKNGQINGDRSWATGEKIVSEDDDLETFDFFVPTKNRNPAKPLKGFRRNLGHIIETQICDFNDVETSTVDRVLPGYSECSFEITRKEFELNNFEPIVLYVDTPLSVVSFIETC
jgi:hypothetical protein